MSFKPTDEDEKLWGLVTKGAKKYKKANKQAKTPPPSSKPKKTQAKAKTKQVVIPSKLVTTVQEPQLNKRDYERLRKGQIEIEARIDLHGMRQEQAMIALEQFILNAALQKMRCVLVITGKGSISSPSILRQNLPEWLQRESLRPYVLKWTQAHAKDGGSGAFYVYLKRK